MICYFLLLLLCWCFFFCKQKTAYEMRSSDWSSDVCSSDLEVNPGDGPGCRVDASANFEAFTYNAAVNYKPDSDTLLYASLRRGFRSGGFAARATTEIGLTRPFKPEFEIGRAPCRERVSTYV